MKKLIVLAVLAAIAQAGVAQENSKDKDKDKVLTGKDVTEENLTEALAPKPAGEMRLRTLSVGAAAGTASPAAAPAAAGTAAGASTTGGSTAGAATAGAPAAGAAKAGASPAGAATAGAATAGATTAGATTAGAATAGASTAGAAVAAPAAAAPRASASLLITFQTSSADLTDSARDQLDVLARALKGDKLKGLTFTLEGHADPRGNAQSNLTLSQARAESVRRYLMSQHGIEAARLQAVGKGDRELMNKSNAVAPENRRVTIVTQ